MTVNGAALCDTVSASRRDHPAPALSPEPSLLTGRTYIALVTEGKYYLQLILPCCCCCGRFVNSMSNGNVFTYIFVYIRLVIGG